MTFGLVRKPANRRFRWPVACAAWLCASAALACSTVAIGPADAPLVAYSYDTSATGAGFVIVNPAGAERTSIMEAEAARWQSLHGSVTFNQMGPGMPTVGMNTAGLVVSLMWNDEAAYPPPAGRAVVNELEFIQRLLDRAASVDQAVTLMDEIGVQALVPIHYFIADASGATAAVTPTPENLVVHTGADMPMRALTNTSYADLLGALEAYQGFGGDRPLPSATATKDPDSLERFVLAASAAEADQPATRDDAFAALADVENSQTRWQIVFAPDERAVEFALAGRAERWRLDLADIDFTCRATPLARRLAELTAGEAVPGFEPIGADGLTDVLTEVMIAFHDQMRLPPSIAGELAEAQLAALRCVDG